MTDDNRQRLLRRMFNAAVSAAQPATEPVWVGGASREGGASPRAA